MESLHDGEQVGLSQVKLAPEDITVSLVGYQVLRDEIIKRIDIMYQIHLLALIVPATIFGYGLQNQNASFLLSYPVLGMCLSFAWSTNEKIIRRISSYIKINVVSRLGEDNIGWERHVSRHKLLGLDDALAVMGIFLGTEILAIILGWSVAIKSSPIVPLPLLLTLAMISIAITAIVLLRPFLVSRKKKLSDFFLPSIDDTKKIKQG